MAGTVAYINERFSSSQIFFSFSSYLYTHILNEDTVVYIAYNRHGSPHVRPRGLPGSPRRLRRSRLTHFRRRMG